MHATSEHFDKKQVGAYIMISFFLSFAIPIQWPFGKRRDILTGAFPGLFSTQELIRLPYDRPDS